MTDKKKLLFTIKRCLAAAVLLVLLLSAAACGGERVDTLTYAVFPYLPDAEYYQELIERRWAELEPNIRLVRAEWDCYEDGAPKGIDVVMYDAVMRDALIAEGWIRPIEKSAVRDGAPQYLLLARESPYRPLAESFPLYRQLARLARDGENHVILTP